MRKLIFLFVLFVSFSSQAQKLNNIGGYGIQSRRIVGDTLVGLPSDTFFVSPLLRSIPFLANKGGTLYVWNTSSFYWQSVGGGAASVPQNNIGTMYSKTTWSNLSDFIDNSSGAAISANKIQFSGGTNSANNSLGISMYNGLERYSVSTIIVQDTTQYATSFGVGLGSRSVNSTGGASIWQYYGFLDLSNGGNAGKVSILTGGTSYTTRNRSSSAITFSQNDRILFSVTVAQNIITVSATNITTNGATVSASYQYNFTGNPWPPNTGNISVFNLGGKYHLDSLGWNSNEPINSTMFVGDSKTTGGMVTDINYRFGTKYNNSYGTAVINSGVSDKTSEILLILPQIINYVKPKQIFLAIGSNDLRAGVSTGTWQANYASIVSQLTAAGIAVKNLLPFPETSLNQTALYNFIVANYATTYINTYTPLLNCTNCLAGDGIHPNNLGNTTIYNALVATSPPYANTLNRPIFNLRNQTNAVQDFSVSIDTLQSNWVRVNTATPSGYRLDVPDSARINGVVFSKVRSGFGTPALYTPGFISIQNDNSNSEAGANLTIFGSVDAYPPEIRLTTEVSGRGLNKASGVINGFNYNSGIRQPLYIVTSGFGATTAGPVIIRPGVNYSNGLLNFGSSGDSVILELNPSSTYRAKFYVNGKTDLADSLRLISIPRSTDTTGVDIALINRTTGNVTKMYPGVLGIGSVTSVSSGYGTNFSTITNTGSVIIDSTKFPDKTQSNVISGPWVFSSAPNTTVGYRVNGAAASGTFLRGDGTNYVNSTLTIPNTSTSQRVVYSTGTSAYGESPNLSFDGNNLTVGSSVIAAAFSTSSTGNIANFFTGSTTGTTGQSQAGYLLPGGASTGFRAGINGITASTQAVGADYGQLVVAAGAFTEAASGTHPRAFGAAVLRPTITNGAGATDTLVGLYVAGPPTGVTANTGSWGQIIASGDLLIKNGAVNLNGTTSPLQLNGSAGSSGQILRSGGAGNTPSYSTATYPATAGTSGNVLTSDGTNFTSSPNTGEWTTLQVSGSDATTTGQTLVGVTGLITPTLSQSSNYEIEAMLIVTTTAVATGTEYGVNCTGTGTSQGIIYIGPSTVSGGVQVMNEVGTNANNTASSPAMLTTNSETGVVWIRGVVGTGTGSPTIEIRHLKVTSGTSTVKVGSIMRYRKL